MWMDKHILERHGWQDGEFTLHPKTKHDRLRYHYVLQLRNRVFGLVRVSDRSHVHPVLGLELVLSWHCSAAFVGKMALSRPCNLEVALKNGGVLVRAQLLSLLRKKAVLKDRQRPHLDPSQGWAGGRDHFSVLQERDAQDRNPFLQPRAKHMRMRRRPLRTSAPASNTDLDRMILEVAMVGRATHLPRKHRLTANPNHNPALPHGVSALAGCACCCLADGAENYSLHRHLTYGHRTECEAEMGFESAKGALMHPRLGS
jgi:hypothetical protein